MTPHQLPHCWAPRAAFAGDRPGLWRWVGHAGCELEFQLHVLGQLQGGREEKRIVVLVGLQWFCYAMLKLGVTEIDHPQLAEGPWFVQPTNPCLSCAAWRDIYLKQASTQSLECDTERAGAALARESQVIERGVAHNGVLRVWCGTTFVADIQLLPLGTRVGVAEQEWLRGA